MELIYKFLRIGTKVDIRVVVGLEFGVTYSGFSYCHIHSDQNIITNDYWPGICAIKMNTALRYDENYDNVISWGSSALTVRPSRKNKKNKETRLVELCKLHDLGHLGEEFRPNL